jgi:hypothetical protein
LKGLSYRIVAVENVGSNKKIRRMKMEKMKGLGLLMAFTVLIGCSNWASANIIVNGNFDTDLSGWITTGWGWYDAASTGSPDGPAALFVSYPVSDWLTQICASPALVDGQTYVFSFLASGAGPSVGTLMQVNIVTGSGTHSDYITLPGSYQEFSIEYTATAADVGQSLTVGFFGTTGYIMGVDTVSFDAVVPEPTTMGLLLSGVVIGLIRRKR